MKLKSSLRSFLALTGSTLLLATQSHAATFYWDTNNTTGGLGDASSQTWGAGVAGSADLRNFLPNPDYRGILNGTLAPTASNATASGDYIFFGTVNLALGSNASTIAIASGGVNISTIVFSAGQGTQGVTLTGGGGTITLGTSPSIVANNTGTNTIGAVLTGTAGMTMVGPGTVKLTGAETYTGTTTLQGGGTLQVGDGTSGNLFNTTPTALSFSAGGGTINFNEAAGSTQGMGALTFSAGDGTVTSTAASVSSTQTVTFASLAARAAGATGNFSLGVNTTSTGGTPNKIVLTGATAGVLLDKGLFFNGSSYAAYDSGGFVRALNYATSGGDTNTVDANTITASKHVKLTSSPASRAGDTLLSLNLAGGGVNYTMSSGSLTVPAILKSGGGSVSTISGGTSVTTAGNAELVIRTDTASDLLTISSAVTSFSGGLTKTGAGTLTLSGTNGYTGTTNINAGTLEVSGGNAIADGNTVNLANAAGATFKLSGNETITSLTGGGFSGGNVDVQGNTLTVGGTSSSMTFSGQLTGLSTGQIIKNGTGTLTLPNQNSFAGTLTLNAGTLELDMANNVVSNVCMVSSGGAINMNGSSTIYFNTTVGGNAAQFTLGQFGWQGTAGFPRPFEYGMGNAINVTGTASTLKFGNLNNTGWRFSGNVTGSSSGDAVLNLANAAVNGDQSYTFTGIIADGTGHTLGLNISNQSNDYINLSAANTFTGPITLANSSITNASYLVIGGERNVTGSAAGSGYIGGGNYTGAITLGAFTILDYASSANQTLGGIISGAGALLKEGTGTLTLSAANNYTGAVTVSYGALELKNSGSTAFSQTTTGALTLAGPDVTLQSTKASTGSISTTFGSYTARVAGNSANIVSSGGTVGIDNSIKFTAAPTLSTTGIMDKGLFFNGSSYAAYDATSGYVRAYTTSDGNAVSSPTAATLGVNDATKNAFVTGAITAQTTAAVNTLNLAANDLAISSGQTLSVNGILSSGASNAQISGGTLKQTATTAGLDTVVRVNGSSDKLTIGSIIANNSGAQGLTKSGDGTLVLTNTSSYTGATSVNGGKLTISSTGNINTTSGIAIGTGDLNYNNSSTALTKAPTFKGTGGTLSGIGTITPAVTITSGNTLAPGNSIGSLSFGTGLTLAGTYNVELGTVNVNPASSLSDRSAVTGGLAIGGNLTLVNNANANSQGSAAAGAYRIATYTTTLSGTFASITNSLSSTLHEKVVYGPASGGGNVDLNLYRLATGSTSALNIGKARVGGSLTGNLTTTNSATADGFSERLNATGAVTSGAVNSVSGSVSGLIPGASSSTISVGLNTATTGNVSGTATLSYFSDGTGTSGYGTTANGSQVVTVSGTVYDYASQSLTGDAGLTGGPGSYTYNFGTVNQFSAASTTFNLANIFSSAFQDNLGGSFSYTGATEFTDLTSVITAILAGNSNNYGIAFNTSTLGSFSGTLTFNGLSQQTGLLDASLSPLTISINGTVAAVPEPRAALLGGFGLLALLRRRRN